MNHGATAADATAAILVVFAFAVAVLRAFELFERSFYFMIDPAEKLKQAKLGQFSMLSILNWIVVCLNPPYN